MTNLDAATLAHLDRWLEQNVRDEDARTECRRQMIIVVQEDQDHWLNAGWPRVYDRADGPTIEEGMERLWAFRADDTLVDCETGRLLI